MDVSRTQLSVVLSVVLSYPRIGKFRYILTAVKATEKTGLQHSIYRFLIILGLFNLFFSSLIVCFLTLFQRTADGNLQFSMPKEFIVNITKNKFRNFFWYQLEMNYPRVGHFILEEASELQMVICNSVCLKNCFMAIMTGRNFSTTSVYT
jgi:hypothetical protein